MDFSIVADFFQKIESASSRLEMTDFYAELLNKTDLTDIKEVIYLSQGKIAPDFNGIELGLGENLVIEAIRKTTGYSKEKIMQDFLKKGDLGEVIYFFSANKIQKTLFKEVLSVQKVFSNLKRIGLSSGHGSQETKLKLLSELFNSANASEAKFIARIVLGKTRLGLGDSSIMDALAIIYSFEFPILFKKELNLIEENLKEKKEEKRKIETDLRIKQNLKELIESKYNIHPDLGFICFKLKEKGLKGLNEIEIETGIPIRPTLAERLSNAEEIIEKLGKCIVEGKYDGLRLQCHKNKDEVIIFSRKQENMTAMFPELVKGIQEQIKAEKVIFEGEALAFNEKEKKFYPFQITMQRKRKYGVKEKSEEVPLTLFCFDLMYLNGKNLMDLTLTERRKSLNSIIGKGKRIKLTDSILASDAKTLEKFFNESVSKGLEGIIAKDLNAKYIAGARKFAWIKLKKSYNDELNDSMDLVIIGFFKGKGKRTQFGVGALLCAVFDSIEHSFKSVAKIGTGLSEEQLKELNELLSVISLKEKPLNVVSEIIPDVWVEPKYVIEVIADEITRSPIHAAAKSENNGLALRFPRMIQFRQDKNPEDATTENELISLFERNK
ncbi:MAG: ATP-dependent DNA ligase [Candidatus Diapherotrites archaeon]|nr:ATP-dependent DNA ligase [Candidatus Diapherotrites archaeon]